MPKDKAETKKEEKQKPLPCPLCDKEVDIRRGDFEHSCKGVTISSQEMGGTNASLTITWNKYVTAILRARKEVA